jgi:hypothetical protein
LVDNIDIMIRFAVLLLLIPAYLCKDAQVLMLDKWFGSKNNAAKYPEFGRRLRAQVSFERCYALCIQHPSICFAFDHHTESNTCVMYRKQVVCAGVAEGGPWQKTGWTCYARETCPSSPQMVAPTSSLQAQPFKSGYDSLLQYLLGGGYGSFNLNKGKFESLGDETNKFDLLGRQGSAASFTCPTGSILNGFIFELKRGVIAGGGPPVGTTDILACIRLCTTCYAVTFIKTGSPSSVAGNCFVHSSQVNYQTTGNQNHYFLKRVCIVIPVISTLAPATIPTTLPNLDPKLSESAVFSCDVYWQRFNNASATAGAIQAGVVTADDCKLACFTTTDGGNPCTAVDFNTASNECFMHFIPITTDTNQISGVFTQGTTIDVGINHYRRTKDSASCNKQPICFLESATVTDFPTTLINFDVPTNAPLPAGVTEIACPGLCQVFFSVDFTNILTTGAGGALTFIRGCDTSGRTRPPVGATGNCIYTTGAFGDTIQSGTCYCEGSRCNGHTIDVLIANTGHWPFDGHLDDLSGYERQGQAYGGLQFSDTEKKRCQSACFNGSSYLTLPFQNIEYSPYTFLPADVIAMTPSMNHATPVFTMTFWVMRKAGTTGTMTIINNQAPVGTVNVHSLQSATADMMNIQATFKVKRYTPVTGAANTFDVTQTITATTSDLAIGAWHFLVIRVSEPLSTSLKLDIFAAPDGLPPVPTLPVGTTELTGLTTATDVAIAASANNLCVGKMIGAAFGPHTQYFIGYLDELRIFKSGLIGTALDSIMLQSTIQP